MGRHSFSLKNLDPIWRQTSTISKSPCWPSGVSLTKTVSPAPDGHGRAPTRFFGNIAGLTKAPFDAGPAVEFIQSPDALLIQAAGHRVLRLAPRKCQRNGPPICLGFPAIWDTPFSYPKSQSNMEEYPKMDSRREFSHTTPGVGCRGRECFAAMRFATPANGCRTRRRAAKKKTRRTHLAPGRGLRVRRLQRAFGCRPGTKGI